jgi:hypothetical protein
VKLDDPDYFMQILEANGAKLKVLPIKKDPPMSMGMEVAALGFPLGTQSLKISRGVVAGTEMLDNKICFQQTAPISPGSSGGPLFAVEDMHQKESQSQVIGVNFAASAGGNAQNNNYVIPLVHIRQILNEFSVLAEKDTTGKYVSKITPAYAASGTNMIVPRRRDPLDDLSGKQPMLADEKVKSYAFRASSVDSATNLDADDLAIEAESSSTPQKQMRLMSASTSTGIGADAGSVQLDIPKYHFQMRIAPVSAVAVEANPLLYQQSNGCTSGVFLSKIPKPSVLGDIPEQSFLVSVGGAALDQFGMGRHAGYLDNPLPFPALMAMNDRLEDQVTLKVCKDGKETEHQVSMNWDEHKYALGVPVIEEPLYQTYCRDFEVFAGATLAEMTANHIQMLLTAGVDPKLGRFMEPEARLDPRLVVVHSQSGSYASRVLRPGMVVEKINDKKVTDLRSYRDLFLDSYFSNADGGGIWKIETDQGVLFQVHFKDAWDQQIAEIKKNPVSRYLDTPALANVALHLEIEKLLTDLEQEGATDAKDFLSKGFDKLKADGKGSATDELKDLLGQAQVKREAKRDALLQAAQAVTDGNRSFGTSSALRVKRLERRSEGRSRGFMSTL